MNLLDKKILFIAPEFYNYHSEIITTLTSKGAEVDFYSEIHQQLLYRLTQKINRKLSDFIERKYVSNILSHIQEDMYDIVFVIRGEMLTPDSMRILRRKLPSAKFYLYQWDSILQNNYLSIVKFFDSVQTFDVKDSTDNSIEYLPLFFLDKYKSVPREIRNKSYDLVFFGAYHSDRLKIIKFLEEKLDNNGMSFKYHLYITKLALVRLLLSGKLSLADASYFKTTKVNVGEIIEAYRHSEAVLDIELSIQSGLSIRTFEVLGSNRKLITTNVNITNEPFFDSDKVYILDRNNLKLDVNFFKKSFSDGFYFPYSIDRWIENIFKQNTAGR